MGGEFDKKPLYVYMERNITMKPLCIIYTNINKIWKYKEI
jgi:hypothetical protein